MEKKANAKVEIIVKYYDDEHSYPARVERETTVVGPVRTVRTVDAGGAARCMYSDLVREIEKEERSVKPLPDPSPAEGFAGEAAPAPKDDVPF